MVAQTFLFSDIEGSTARWETYGPAMADALRRHDALLHAAIVAHHGSVFKTVGDQFCAVFDDPHDALVAAIDGQRAIADADWRAVGGLRVRMAVHSGEAESREGDFFGPTVNRVARLLSAGHGGQILASSDAAGSNGAGSNGLTLRDLGNHRLKDIPDATQVFQVVATGLPEVFPPLRTIGGHPNNLPHNLTKLVGRADELAEVKRLLGETMLLSIVGTGGVGKTTIALQAATDLLDAYDDGVWYVELAPLSANASVADAVAAAIGLTTLLADGSSQDTVVAYLRAKSALIVLDNCEHLVGSAADCVGAILKNCPATRVMVTTREILSVQGEQAYHMPSLSFPALEEDVMSRDDALAYGAIALFVERARGHVPSFALTDENAATVAAICARLEGIALAIELAAPRLRMLSVTQLLDGLNERFRVLTGGRRTALPRQQTMHALIEWSHELLTDNERIAFRRCAVFAGGWAAAAAMEVCGDESFGAWDVLDAAAALADKSLLIVEQTEPEPRYRMLESTREYAMERLGEAGETDNVARRHAEYHLQLAERADGVWKTTPAKAWIAPLALELDDFRSAMEWCVTSKHDLPMGLHLFVSLEALWWDAKPLDGWRWVVELAPLVETIDAPEDRARYWLTGASVALTIRQQKLAVEYAQKALAAYETLRSAEGIANAQRCLGAALINLGRADEGEPLLTQALASFRATGNRRLIAIALRNLGAPLIWRSEFERAVAIYREALALSTALDDERGVQMVLGNLAEAESGVGKFADALVHEGEALTIARARRERFNIGATLVNVAAYLIALERFEDARSAAREALKVAAAIESELLVAVALQRLGAVAAHQGDPDLAARLLGASTHAYDTLETAREPNEAREYDAALVLLQSRRAADELAVQVRRGQLQPRAESLADAVFV